MPLSTCSKLTIDRAAHNPGASPEPLLLLYEQTANGRVGWTYGAWYKNEIHTISEIALPGQMRRVSQHVPEVDHCQRKASIVCPAAAPEIISPH
jgi:hypothetical protein